MTDHRNPRLNPRPGDVVGAYHVLFVDDKACSVVWRKHGVEGTCTIWEWRSRVEDALVVVHADLEVTK